MLEAYPNMQGILKALRRNAAGKSLDSGCLSDPECCTDAQI